MKSTVTFNSERKELTFFENNKPVAGIIGPMAEVVYNRIKSTIEKESNPAVRSIKQNNLTVQ
jgi:hypothetical protein